ncbi:MAG TPA: YmdB family metallophosphoesterase, partial [Tepidisphaeraceae bacterium]|nr:YmdB family metallophosphoesterase [Tepidisphaeraceae bacterium]
MPLRILTLGDIVGRPGRSVVCDHLPALVTGRKIDLVIANGENIAGGSGITPNLFNKLRSYGVDVVTLGDHVFKRLEIVQTMTGSERILRPANLAQMAAGRTHTIVQTNSGHTVAILTVLGRIYMNMPADDPFAAVEPI